MNFLSFYYKEQIYLVGQMIIQSVSADTKIRNLASVVVEDGSFSRLSKIYFKHNFRWLKMYDMDITTMCNI